MDYLPELNELAERALAKIIDNADDAIVTRGILIIEILRPSDSHRGVVAVQLGRQGEMPPWDIVGLLAPVALKAQANMAETMFGFGGEDNDPPS